MLALRKKGGTYLEIANAAVSRFGRDNLPKGWDERYAYKDVSRELEKMRNELAEHVEAVRELELQRLDDLLKGLWDRATGKDIDYPAIDRVLKIMERRARLTGLDAAQQMDLQSGGEPIVMKFSGNIDPNEL